MEGRARDQDEVESCTTFEAVRYTVSFSGQENPLLNNKERLGSFVTFMIQLPPVVETFLPHGHEALTYNGSVVTVA